MFFKQNRQENWASLIEAPPSAPVTPTTGVLQDPSQSLVLSEQWMKPMRSSAWLSQTLIHCWGTGPDTEGRTHSVWFHSYQVWKQAELSGRGGGGDTTGQHSCALCHGRVKSGSRRGTSWGPVMFWSLIWRVAPLLCLLSEISSCCTYERRSFSCTYVTL